MAVAAGLVTGTWAEPMPEVERGRIYVPEPRGKEETLDDSTGPSSGDGMDIVTTRHGDRLYGRVVSIEAGGKLRLTGPQFVGEALVEVAALDNVALSCKRKREDLDKLLITNGDRILGELVAITPDAVVVESDAMGVLKVRRKKVHRIVLSRRERTLIESNFAAGRMELWETRKGTWSIVEGGLACQTTHQPVYFGRGFEGPIRINDEEGWAVPQRNSPRATGEDHYAGIFAPLEQKGSLTIEAKVQDMGGSALSCSLVLLADAVQGGHGLNSVSVRFEGNEYSLELKRNGSTTKIGGSSLDRDMSKGVLRMTCDPAAGKVRLWVDSTELG